MNQGLLPRCLAIMSTSALAIVFFWWLSEFALERHLLSRAADHQQQLQHGWRWEFEQLSDLVGQSATGLLELELNQGRLAGYRGDGSGFLSLNFRGRRLDARIHHLLQIRIWLERAAPLGIFHSELLGGPVISATAVDLQAGWQLLELDLAQRAWQANIYHHRKLVSGPEAATWGGDFGIVSSLRIHPTMRADNHFEIDWIRLLPSAPTSWTPRSRIELASLDLPLPAKAHADMRTPLLVLPEQLNTVERILVFRDQVNQILPAASLVPSSAEGFGAATTPSPKQSLPVLTVALLAGLAGLLATIAGKRRFSTRSLALAQLTGLLALATTLLTWADNEASEDPVLALTLALITALMVALLWQAREPLMRSMKVASSAWSDTTKLAMASLIPLVVLVVFNDSITIPPLAETLPRLGSYLIWATLQQMTLCLVLLGITQRLGFRQQAASLAATIVFGLAHFPNFALMVGTLILAQFCLWLYRQHDSLLPGIALHTTLGTLYLELMPETLLRSGAIGERFFS